jgi:membrane protein DedA with SNARE-associated domain
MNEVAQFLIEQGYLVLFLWVLLAQLGFPIPIVPMLLAGGALAGIGELNAPLVLSISFLAALLSDQFWYQVGLRRGSKVLPFLCRIALDPESCVRRAKGIFGRYGPRFLLVAKFIPGVATVASPLAGIFHLHPLRFLLLDGVGTFIWVGILIFVGYKFGNELKDLTIRTSGTGPGIGLLIPVGLAIYMTWKYVHRKRFLHRLAIARVTPEEVKQRLDAGEDLLMVDLRHAVEFEVEPRTIPGAIHLSIEELEKQHHQIPRDREIVLFCN